MRRGFLFSSSGAKAKARPPASLESSDIVSHPIDLDPVAEEWASAVPELPDALWTEVAKHLDRYDHIAFALTSRSCRRALDEVESKRGLGERIEDRQGKAGRRRRTIRTDLRELYWGAPSFSFSWFRWVFDKFDVRSGKQDRRQKRVFDPYATCFRDEIYDNDLAYLAGIQGRKDVLAWMRSARGCMWVDPNIANGVAHEGHVDVLAWLYETGCPKDVTACGWAARGGHIRCLDFLIKEAGAPLRQEVCRSAAAGGHLDVLKYLRSLEPSPCPWNEETTTSAAAEGHLDMLKWATNGGCPLGMEACAAAAWGGQIEVLDWLVHDRSTAMYLEAECFVSAADGGQLETMKWLLHHGCPWDYEVAEAAAAKGRLDVLKWLRTARWVPLPPETEGEAYPWCDETIFSFAARSGDMEVLKWLREEKCRWDAETFSSAAAEGHLKVCEWLLENKCPWKSECGWHAAGSGQVHILKWLKSVGYFDRSSDLWGSCWSADPWGLCWSTHCVSAATNGQLEALKYCRLELKLPLAADCFSEAMRGGHREVAEWLKDQGCPVTDPFQDPRIGAPSDLNILGHDIWGYWVRRDDGRGGVIENEFFAEEDSEGDLTDLTPPTAAAVVPRTMKVVGGRGRGSPRIQRPGRSTSGWRGRSSRTPRKITATFRKRSSQRSSGTWIWCVKELTSSRGHDSRRTRSIKASVFTRFIYGN